MLSVGRVDPPRAYLGILEGMKAPKMEALSGGGFRLTSTVTVGRARSLTRLSMETVIFLPDAYLRLYAWGVTQAQVKQVLSAIRPL